MFAKVIYELDRIDAMHGQLIQEITPDVENATRTAEKAIKVTLTILIIIRK
jgi:hypothetical protein